MSDARITDEQLQSSRDDHRKFMTRKGELYCQGCGEAWPCLEHLLVVEIDRLREALGREQPNDS